MKTGELPPERGATFEEAQANMQSKLQQILEQTYRRSQDEMDAFAKATNHGADKKKVRELAAEIRKRLDATPPATVRFTDSAAPSPTPSVLIPDL